MTPACFVVSLFPVEYVGGERMKAIVRAIASCGAIAMALASPARADVVLSGPDSNDGSYTTARLAADATAGDTETFGGYTGISLWGLLGGAPATPAAPGVYGDIDTAPGGSNPKNTILRYYLVATGAGGQQSVVSLGEIDPTFGNGPSLNAFVAYQNGGNPAAEPSLIVPSQPARDLNNLTSLALLSVPAISGGGGPSAAVQLSGNVVNPGAYTKTQLRNSFSPALLPVGADTYTGVPLWTFLHPASTDPTDQIAIVQATDGYEVVVALGELDPSDGGNPADLLPYEDTAGTFLGANSDGVARTIYPTDNRQGRWVSNVDAIDVVGVPEPGSLTLLAVALAATGSLRRRAFSRRTAPGKSLCR